MPRWLVWLLLLVWGQFFYAIHFWWSVEGSYYEFGWAVFPAALWFFWQRSLDLPASAFPRSSDRPSILLIVVGTVVLTCLILLRFVERSYVFWRLPIWLHAFLIVAVHHGVLYRYRYPAGFAWITLFSLTAVPLPSFVERFVVDYFTNLVMRVSETVALFLSLPVVRSGMALVANGEVLGITEGCSGIRSIQALSMISLACGELFCLSFVSRIALFAAGSVLAFGFNSVRTVILTWVYFQYGADSFHAVHDPAGSVSFCASVALTAVVARLLR